MLRLQSAARDSLCLCRQSKKLGQAVGRVQPDWDRSFSVGNDSDVSMQQKVVFTAEKPKRSAEDTQKAIRHATMLMAGGMGSAFMGAFGFQREKERAREGTVTVNCDAGVTRKFELTDEAATGQNPSLKEIIEKGGTFMFIDKEAGEILDAEMLDTLLQSDRGIRDEKVTAEPVQALDFKTFESSLPSPGPLVIYAELAVDVHVCYILEC
eukprot:s1411_g5.t4